MREETIGDCRLTCVVCAAYFKVKPYRMTTAKFCSQACGGKWHAENRLNKGPKDYMRGNKLRAGLRPTNAFTSDHVRGSANPNWKAGLRLECYHCGSNFSQKPWLARQNGVAKYCSRGCFEASGCFVGEKSPAFVGGITTYRGKGWMEARADVVADQEGRCNDCGKVVGHSLPVHHKVPFRAFVTAVEANDRKNLVGLCQSCHMRSEASVPRPESKPQQLTLDAL